MYCAWFGVRGLITPRLVLILMALPYSGTLSALCSRTRASLIAVDLFRFNILNLAAHWRGIDIQACQNIGRGVHADGAAGQFKVIVAAVDLNTQPTLQLFDVVVKRAAQC